MYYNYSLFFPLYDFLLFVELVVASLFPFTKVSFFLFFPFTKVSVYISLFFF